MKFIDKLFLLIFFSYTIKYYKKLKVCICTIGKKENLYAKEFVDYYKNLGVNKIFLYDNNEIDDEKFDTVIKDYINEGFVEIIDIRGIVAPQIRAMEDCRKKNYMKFDWLIFYDMDEYLFLRNYSNVNDYLNQKVFAKCQRIQLNWFFHTDNNQLYYDNRTLKERFPEKEKKWEGIKIGGIEGIKSILKGKINITIKDTHILNSKLIPCDGFGKIKEIQNIITNESDHYYYYIDHYYCKSTEEFAHKLLRGSVSHGNNTDYYMKRLLVYFSMNNITGKKINYLFLIII